MTDVMDDYPGVCRKLSAGSCSPCFCPTKCDHRRQGIACNCEPICQLAGQIPPAGDGGHWEGDFYVVPAGVWWDVKSRYFPRQMWALPAVTIAKRSWWTEPRTTTRLQALVAFGTVSFVLDVIRLIVRHFQ